MTTPPSLRMAWRMASRPAPAGIRCRVVVLGLVLNGGAIEPIVEGCGA